MLCLVVPCFCSIGRSQQQPDSPEFYALQLIRTRNWLQDSDDRGGIAMLESCHSLAVLRLCGRLRQCGETTYEKDAVESKRQVSHSVYCDPCRMRTRELCCQSTFFCNERWVSCNKPSRNEDRARSGIHEVSALMTLTLKSGRDVGILDGQKLKATASEERL
jgi:hypothetical protein